MQLSGLLRTALAIALVGSLSGCIAAVVPLAAGGAIFGKQVADEEDAPKSPPDPVVALPGEQAVSAPADGEQAASDPLPSPPPTRTIDGIEMVASEAVTDGSPGPASTGEAQAAPGLRPDLGFNGPERVELPPSTAEPEATTTHGPATTPVRLARAEVPPPLTSNPAQSALSQRGYDAFYGYVDTQAQRDPVEAPRASAVLAAPGLLRPDRTDCSIRPPAVVIDLDPDGAGFDADNPAAPNRALGQMLASLRLQAVDIFWISRLPAIEAAAVRQRLAESGLDPQGDDQLLLMRRADDRKQLRRREVSETHCLIAIAGDTREDFDELFQYLKDRETAQPLEELVGAGWFLTPLPIEKGM